MSTAHHHLHQGHAFLSSGNVALVHAVDLTDPQHLPLGGPATPGEWFEVSQIEDPGGHLVVDLADEADVAWQRPLVLDPPELVDDPASPVDYEHLDRQYTEPAEPEAMSFAA